MDSVVSCGRACTNACGTRNELSTTSAIVIATSTWRRECRGRAEAAEILRGLIDAIVLTPSEGALQRPRRGRLPKRGAPPTGYRSSCGGIWLRCLRSSTSVVECSRSWIPSICWRISSHCGSSVRDTETRRPPGTVAVTETAKLRLSYRTAVPIRPVGTRARCSASSAGFAGSSLLARPVL
jgi:hypothetical protein